MNAAPQTNRRRLLFKGVFVVSLALNLLFVGMIAGAAWRTGGEAGQKRGQDQAWQGFAAPYVRALVDDDRRSLMTELRRAHPRPDRASRRATYEQMLAILRADTFDRNAVAALLSQQQSGIIALQTAAKDNWLDVISAMPAAERAAYADRLEALIKRGPRDRRKKDR